MRLYDRVKLYSDEMPEMPVIVADEIAKMLDEMPDLPEGTSYPAEWYGCVAPPFQQFFVEADTILNGGLVRRGTAVMASTRDGYEDRWPDDVNAKWIMIFICYAQYDGDFIQYPGIPGIALDENGMILDDMKAIKVAFPDGDAEEGITGVSLLPFTLKAISAMHKRVEAEKVEPSRQQRRHFQRKYQTERAPTDYWVLKVKPSHTPHPGEQNRGKGVSPREHKVRGHFRYYREEKPLFGRYSGMVWVPEHERGSDTIGKIRKDYEVK